MKKYLSVLTAVSMLALFGAAHADSVVVKETTDWKGYPVTVDETAHTYTTTETVPAGATNYYYSYKGHRCFTEKRDFVGVDFVLFKAGVPGGTDIYCYPE